MPRLRRKHLPHRVTVTPFLGDGAEGDLWGAPIPDVPAYAEQKSRLKVDRRSTSATSGQEITSSTTVVLLPEHDLRPRTKVTVWKGTPRERTSEVIDSALGMYNHRTPNHVELYLE
ncbi:hypothetical protein GCM10009775_04670 [Microbacterium aoyamense]|uniref:Uncharacterized protein n=1 Tax=Microbacterium aoyamense TaxID=344166 RepID=A0ABN2P8M6_9MICO|nr:hypothetical protein [Microbacterium aoyamense]